MWANFRSGRWWRAGRAGLGVSSFGFGGTNACDCQEAGSVRADGFEPTRMLAVPVVGGGVGDSGKAGSALAAQAGSVGGRYVQARPALDVIVDSEVFALVSTRWC